MSRSLLGAFSLFFALTACTTFKTSERTPASAPVDPRYVQLQILLAESVSFRAEALNFAEKYKVGEGKDLQLNREEGDYLRARGRKYLETRAALMAIAERDKNDFGLNHKIVLAPGKGTSKYKVDKPGPARDRGLKAEQIEVFSVDPTDETGRKAIYNIQMGLAAALLLMDNYVVGVAPYNDNASTRYVLNYDGDAQRKLQEIADSYTNPVKRLQVAQATEFVDAVMAWRRQNMVDTSPEESYLYGITQSTIWYLMEKKGETGNSLTARVENLWNRIMLRGKRGVRAASFGISMGFGNMVGLYEERKGLLYNMSEKEQEGLISEMKPLDILLEKTPFRLTDKFIPGHYGHVAIWTGTERQLKDLNVWDQIPAAIQQRIRNGHYIVEALRPGVQINTLQHFMNIDDFLVLRDNRPIDDAYRRKAVLQAIAQIGKEYDFNFDVNTQNRIVCSEIAYVVFTDVKWPTEEMVKRYTISPDNVAQLAISQNPILDPVILYYNGKRYNKDLRHSLSLLMKATDESYAEFERFHK